MSVMVYDIICFSNSSKILKKQMVFDFYSCADVWNVYECALCCCKRKPTDSHAHADVTSSNSVIVRVSASWLTPKHNLDVFVSC